MKVLWYEAREHLVYCLIKHGTSPFNIKCFFKKVYYEISYLIFLKKIFGLDYFELFIGWILEPA